MAAKEVKLLRYRTSPFSKRIEMALELKGIPFECVDLDDVEDKNALFLEYNPLYKKIPVFVHKGKYIAESLIILEYIDDVWDRYPLMPKDPLERAQLRFLANFIDDKCVPMFRQAYWSEGEDQKTYKQKSKEYLSVIEKEIKGEKFFQSENIGYLDIVTSYIALWLKVIQEVAQVNVFNRDEHPVLWKWSQELLNSNVGRKCLPEKEKLFKFFHGRKEIMKASVKPVNK